MLKTRQLRSERIKTPDWKAVEKSIRVENFQNGSEPACVLENRCPRLTSLFQRSSISGVVPPKDIPQISRIPLLAGVRVQLPGAELRRAMPRAASWMGPRGWVWCLLPHFNVRYRVNLVPLSVVFLLHECARDRDMRTDWRNCCVILKP